MGGKFGAGRDGGLGWGDEGRGGKLRGGGVGLDGRCRFELMGKVSEKVSIW